MSDVRGVCALQDRLVAEFLAAVSRAVSDGLADWFWESECLSSGWVSLSLGRLGGNGWMKCWVVWKGVTFVGISLAVNFVPFLCHVFALIGIGWRFW